MHRRIPVLECEKSSSRRVFEFLPDARDCEKLAILKENVAKIFPVGLANLRVEQSPNFGARWIGCDILASEHGLAIRCLDHEFLLGALACAEQSGRRVLNTSGAQGAAET